jgi:mono/diheme cytochrome c family protein
MITELIVLTEEEYAAWIDGMIADKFKPVVMAEAMNPESEEIVKRDGPALYKTYCISCHGPEGKGGLVENARNFTKLDGWKRSPKITDIYRTLEEGVAGTQMRSFNNLSPWDRFALAHYVAAFYKGSDRPEATSEEIEKLNADYKLDEKREPRKTIPIEDAMRAYVEESGTGKAGGTGAENK